MTRKNTRPVKPSPEMVSEAPAASPPADQEVVGVAVSPQTFEATLKYLVTRPFSEVADLLGQLQQSQTLVKGK